MRKDEQDQEKYTKYFRISVTVGILLFLLVASIFLWRVFATYAIAWATFFVTLFSAALVIFLIGLAVSAVIWLLFFFLLPFAFYIVQKLHIYLSLSALAKKRGATLKITRAPFASLFKLGKKPDIIIEMDGVSYHVIFVDILFKNRRLFMWLNEREFCISPISPGPLRKWGLTPAKESKAHGFFQFFMPFRRQNIGFYRDGYIVEGDNNRTKKIPVQTADPAVEELLVVFPVPVAKLQVREHKVCDLDSGNRKGDMTFLLPRDLTGLLTDDFHVDLTGREL